MTVFLLPALLCVAADEKAAKSITAVQDTWSVPGIMGGGVKGNDAYVDGSFFLTLPVYSTIGRDGWLAGDVIFIEPYTSWGEEGEVAVSLGLGWRHLFSEQSAKAVTHHDGHQAGFFEEGAFIGANLFVDMLDTQFDNRFWQLGFGLEAGTRYVELRANYYLPLSDRQLAEEIRTQESFSTQATVPTTYHEPFATGHTIQQDVTFTTYRSTTTIERLFRRYEDGMEGWDAEVALLLPWIDRWMDVKVIGGYYAFDNQPFGPQTGGTGNVEGWKAGVELRPVPAVVLNATWYEDERLTGGDWTAGLRLEVPFEAGDLGDGKGFWDRIGDAFRPRRRHLAERMAEPVRRQNAAIQTSTSVEEDKDAAEVKVVTKVVSQSKQRIVLADTVVFVDNAIGSPTNPGTYEAPLDTIQNGENLGNSAFGNNAIVFVQGRPQPYAERVNISQGVRLFGSSPGFPVLGGRAFHGRTHDMPLVDGGFSASNIPALVEINGFNIAPLSFGSSVFFLNVSQGIVAHNVFRADNLSTVSGTNFIHVETTGSTVSQMVIAYNQTLDDNALEPLTAGLTMITRDSASLTALIEGNTFGRGGVGVNLFSEGNARSDFTLIGNTIQNSAHDGLTVLAQENAISTLTLSDNDIIFNSQHSGPLPVPQINVQVFHSAIIHFNSMGVLSNALLKIPGDTEPLYHIETSGGAITGSILINGIYHPANVDLP